MTEEKKRKGYATKEQQLAANRRYYNSSDEARDKRKRSNYKSAARNFIENYANFEELKWLESLIKQAFERLDEKK